MTPDRFRQLVLKQYPTASCEVDGEHLFFTKRTPFAGAVKMKVDITKIPMMGSDIPQSLFRGYDVEQMTRVTGYFSKISSWNEGKRAELDERHRNDKL